MSQQFKSPTLTMGPKVMSPFLASSPRHVLPTAWYPPSQPWCIKNGTPPQGSGNPYYNQWHSCNGYWGSPRQWSPNRWEPSRTYHHTWRSSPRAHHNSHFKHSPEHSSVYSERKDNRTQVPFKQKRGYTKDISQYYSPSMVEDPWAELQAKNTKSTSQDSAGVHHSFIARSQAPS
ncbi:gastrula-specific protein 17-like [Aquarana catesbeiana]|uniref:gastrula-specific protein 17-like n=1 Tax=Aquarana catesbeiana TaxID=8400 RepID=UPI003CCA693E